MCQCQPVKIPRERKQGKGALWGLALGARDMFEPGNYRYTGLTFDAGDILEPGNFRSTSGIKGLFEPARYRYMGFTPGARVCLIPAAAGVQQKKRQQLGIEGAWVERRHIPLSARPPPSLSWCR